MFNTMEIAKRIRQARIEKNMTQMNLADAMGVSYQAVSNWERGNSMPDIAKLEDLCQVLEISVTDLLGMENGAAVDKAIQQEDLTPEELSQVAPMLPPRQVQEQAEKAKQKKKLNVSAIIGLAPFLSEECLAKLVEDAEVENLSEVTALAPFLSEECLAKLVEDAEVENLSEVTALAPFLSEEALNTLAERFRNCGDFDTIMGLAPFLGKDTLRELAMEAQAKDLSQVMALAPFLDGETLEILVSRCEQEADIETICGLAPFLSEQALDALVERLLEKDSGEDFNSLSGLYPFLSKQTLRRIADKMTADRNLDVLSDLMPFV